VIRGHQLIESLLFQFLRDHTSCPEHLEDFHARWDATIALVKAMRYSNQPEEEWVWKSAIRLEKARNRVAHYLDSKESERFVLDFVNCVRANYLTFGSIPGDDELKKALFDFVRKLRDGIGPAPGNLKRCQFDLGKILLAVPQR
jgi:hypothetical protein